LMVRINVQALKNEELAVELRERLNGALTVIANGVQRVTSRVGRRE